MCVRACVCVRAFVRACGVRAFDRSCVRLCMRVCVFVCICHHSSSLGIRCVPCVGEGLSVLSPNYPVLCFPLPYRVAPVFVQVVSPPFAGLPCRIFLSYGRQVVTREVHRSSLRRLICPAQDHFIFFLTVLIISMTFVLSLTQMLVFLSLYVMLSILLSIFVCEAASLLCACLVSVHVSAPYGIAGSTQELYSCLFRQMSRLLLKMSRCLAYAAQPAMILHCISFAMFILRPILLLSSDSSCSICCSSCGFLCIGICHQQSGDWREILRLPSRPCFPSVTF